MTAILVVLTILMAVAVDVVLTKLRSRHAPAGQEMPVEAMLQPRPPQGIFLDPAHSWVRITTDGALRVGIDDFLAEALGEPEAVEAPSRGTQVKRGDPLLRLRVKGRTLVVRAPAGGEVIAVNEHVAEKPWIVARDPYGVGWVVALWTRDHHEAIRPLRIGSAAGAFLRHELQRFADFLTPAGTPATVPLLADGGVPRKGVVATLDEARLDAFQREFLDGEEA
ncbi:MAG: glycine cleavage system protein H [Thermoanaerobaculales bacterium]|jgi:glycine cleavage system H protein